MFHILYVSSATEDFRQSELATLLSESQKRNSRLDVTGILLYKDGNFMQLLEGEEDAVTALYYRIMLDPRHHKVVTLIKEEVAGREFHDWSMGYKDLNDPSLLSVPGYNDFMNISFKPAELNANISRCKRLLALFKNDRV